MNKHYVKWALVVVVFVIILYTWISYFDIDKLQLFNTKDKNLSHPNILELNKNVVWSKIERRTRPKDNEIQDKWIVVTSVAPPTEQVKNLSKIKDWKLVVVADTKTPKNWE